MKKLPLLLIALLLSGCATTWKKTESTEYLDKQVKFAATLPAGWMYFPGMTFAATKDGVQLDLILVETIKFNQDLSSTKRQFKTGMLANELAEVDIDNYRSNAGILHFEILDNQIVELDGKDAYKFMFRYQTTEGMKRKGIVYGIVHRDRVYRVVYTAAEQHYFDLNQQAFEGFIQGFRFL